MLEGEKQALLKSSQQSYNPPYKTLSRKEFVPQQLEIQECSEEGFRLTFIHLLDKIRNTCNMKEHVAKGKINLSLLELLIQSH
jgi:hypothetical protein